MKKKVLSIVFMFLIALSSPGFIKATGYGHNTTISVTNGQVKSQCYTNGKAASGAKCLVNNAAIYVQVKDSSGNIKSATSTNKSAQFQMTELLETAGTEYEHLHIYTTYNLTR